MYKAMFPPLIAGPIVRYASIAPQVDHRAVSAASLTRGVEAFCIGLAQKVLLANTLAGPVDRLFATPAGELGPAAAWLGAAGYGLQIYFDFCGYSNMAIGLGRMIGFELPPNFDRPYAARSVTDFWRRWHISLSTWFRDYLYIPLGGNRHGSARTGFNLCLVFLLCGLWHGASWNFAVWGLYHGAFLIIERAGLARRLAAAPRAVGHAYLAIVVTIGWVPFRADGLGAARAYLGAMFSPGAISLPELPTSFAVAFLAGAACAVWPRSASRPAWMPALRQVAALTGSLLAAISLAAGTYNPFIYFRF